jgi:dolichol-phosphate mannosyltransferase
MKYAMDNMQADAIIEIDADFQHDPLDIPRFVEALDKGADYVIGSRYIKGGAIPPEWGIHRKIISRFGGMFAQIVLRRWNIHDMTSGYKLTKTTFLKHINLDNLYSKYYAYKIQLLHDIMLQKAKTVEVPIIFYERKEGSSKITRKDLFDSFRVVLLLWFRDSKRFIKFLFVGGFGFVIQIFVQEVTILTGLSTALALLLVNLNLARDITAISHSIAAGFGAEAAIISNFLFNNFWTFDDTRKIKEKSNFFIRALKFNLASLASILMQSLVVLLAEKTFGHTVTISSHQLPTRIVVLFPTIILFVIPLNYFIYNVLIWKTQHLKPKKHPHAMQA